MIVGLGSEELASREADAIVAACDKGDGLGERHGVMTSFGEVQIRMWWNTDRIYLFKDVDQHFVSYAGVDQHRDFM